MIRLSKLEEPDVLRRNSERWLARLQEIIGAGEAPSDYLKSRYRHDEIKEVLIRETNGKCAYCESKILHVAFGDVEHIIPKSKRRDLHFTWSNLTLACTVCNNHKGDVFTVEDRIDGDEFIDPYVDVPTSHFAFLGPYVVALPGNDRAHATCSTLRLSRTELVERRMERLDFIRGMIDNYAKSDPRYKQVVINDLMNRHILRSNEFYQTSIEFIKTFVRNGVIEHAHARMFPELM